MLRRVVSGGQTGVDRAALDAAMSAGLNVGGWCPAGRWAEDGPIPAHYPLTETPSADLAQRTDWNVRDSDATLLLARGPVAGGTALTEALCERYGRPYYLVRPEPGELKQAIAWLRVTNPAVLNVGGPRESEDPGIGAMADRFLGVLFTALRAPAV